MNTNRQIVNKKTTLMIVLIALDALVCIMKSVGSRHLINNNYLIYAFYIIVKHNRYFI